jgi:uncharacterized protein
MPSLPPRLRKLEKRLLAHPGEAMQLSELDGFMAGVIVCPELIMPSEWLPHIWGGEDGDPVFDGIEQLQETVDLVMKHYNAIARALHRGEGYTPIFDVDPRHGGVEWNIWIRGFERAMELRPAGWTMVMEGDDEDAGTALAGIAALITIVRDDGELDGEAVKELTAAAPTLIGPWILKLNAWRLRSCFDSLDEFSAPASKVGRNEPCPCGSGIKYKKCCGLN